PRSSSPPSPPPFPARRSSDLSSPRHGAVPYRHPALRHDRGSALRPAPGRPLARPVRLALGLHRRRSARSAPGGDLLLLSHRPAEIGSTRLNSSHEWISYAVSC